MNCIFCNIIKGGIPADVVYKDDTVIAFSDINPKAPVHILIVPIKHIASLSEATQEDSALLGKLLLSAPVIAKKLAIDQTGYKLVINNGKDAGQIVDHLHVHLLGGQELKGLF